MPERVIILQSNPDSAKRLQKYFARRGDTAWVALSVEQGYALLGNQQPTLALIDVHLPENDWLDFLAQVRSRRPEARIIMTNRSLDVRLEMVAKEHGVRTFLREPFTPVWIERALAKLDSGPQGAHAPAIPLLPQVRVPMRIKITLPYVLLALVFISTAAYLVTRYVLESMEDRFNNQLIDAGKLSADWMVQEENRLLETVRLLANTEGMAESIQARDSAGLRHLALPVAVNSQEELVEILDMSGTSVLTLRHTEGGGLEDYAVEQGSRLAGVWDFVQKVLNGQADARGDKFAGLGATPSGDYFAITGPVFDAAGQQVGAVLVGKSLNSIARQMRQDTLAHLTIYAPGGLPLVSTLLVRSQVTPLETLLAQSVLLQQDASTATRSLEVASVHYAEILGPWEARGGQDLGVIGVSLAKNLYVRPETVTRVQAFGAVMLTFVGVIVLGLMMANQITRPLKKVVEASTQVAQGNFQVKVPSVGNDEVMVLAHAFNYMVAGLQEGSIYRDLLGRTVSPQVREALRQSFASGELRLEGHNAVATVLMSDIRNFTRLAEKEEPTTILNWLNEYFAELVPVIASHGGVVDKFEGDALLAFFGILPTPLPPEESSANACEAAVEMLRVIGEINRRRADRAEPPLMTGIGINTGSLIAGGLGTADRLNYTIIGDTVNTTQRIQGLTRDLGENAVVVSENTLAALGGRRGEFRFEPMGEHAFRGKSELLWVYQLSPRVSSERLARSMAPAVETSSSNGHHPDETVTPAVETAEGWRSNGYHPPEPEAALPAVVAIEAPDIPSPEAAEAPVVNDRVSEVELENLDEPGEPACESNVETTSAPASAAAEPGIAATEPAETVEGAVVEGDLTATPEGEAVVEGFSAAEALPAEPILAEPVAVHLRPDLEDTRPIKVRREPQAA